MSGSSLTAAASFMGALDGERPEKQDLTRAKTFIPNLKLQAAFMRMPMSATGRRLTGSLIF